MVSEHEETRLPTIKKLKERGWDEHQIQYQPEYRVPKTPSEASKREKGASFDGYPVDIALFDKPDNRGDWRHIEIIIETKAPSVQEGVDQLEQYLAREPNVMMGVYTNSQNTVALYRTPDGKFKQRELRQFPSPESNLTLQGDKLLTYDDLREVPAKNLKAVFNRLLENIITTDTRATRRDEQLNQICNLVLLKLESDNQGKVNPNDPLKFQVFDDEDTTANKIRDFFEEIVLTHSDLFRDEKDKSLRLDDDTIARVCHALAAVKVLETPIQAISSAFQVFRTATLQSGEGQYFTPAPVIRSGVNLMDIQYGDKIIDPACGTGGFLIECFRQIEEKNPTMSSTDSKRWAQKHLWGVDKDSINVKLTKAMMMILGDGSSHIHIGDSIRRHTWNAKFPHLSTALEDESYTCVITRACLRTHDRQ